MIGVAMTDSSGNVVWQEDYKPFGDVNNPSRQQQAANSRQFIGKELDDETGLHYFLDEVEEHHNEYSHEPGWSEVSVYGVSLTEQLKELLGEYQFSTFDELNTDSFVARK